MSVAALPETTSFTLEASEVRRSIVASRGKPQLWLFGLNALNLANITMMFSRHLRGHEASFVVAYVVLFVIIVLGSVSGVLRHYPRYVKGRNTLVFRESGIVVDGPAGAHRKLPWSDVARAEMDDNAIVCSFAIRARLRYGIDVLVIPKRAFADRGAEVWTFLGERLTGTRYLKRPGSPRKLLVNTAR